MGFSVKVDLSKFNRIKDIIKNPTSDRDAKMIGREAVKLITGSALAGRSPITGKKFPAYRGSYKERISKGQIPGKSLSPVNLQVTGDFLSDLKFRTRKKRRSRSITIGFFNRESILKEEGHRKGTNRQAKRPLIPDKNETFSKRIQDSLIDILVRALNKRLNRVR